MSVVYFEDIELGEKELLGEYVVDRDEMIEYAMKWDPQPFHIDEDAARSSPFGGLIAPVGYTMGIINRMAIERQSKVASMGGLGKDKMRYPIAVRPGDRIAATVEWLHKRESESIPNAGIVTCTVETKNQNDELVLIYEATFMVAKRPTS